uniref:Uncharacterized protein n=1 Tax=Odontella aurita TaxID=265563 RepID=A0A7S4KBM1_9STRA
MTAHALDLCGSSVMKRRTKKQRLSIAEEQQPSSQSRSTHREREPSPALSRPTPPLCDLGNVYVQILESCRPFYYGTRPEEGNSDTESSVSSSDSRASATEAWPILHPRLDDALEIQKKRKAPPALTSENEDGQALEAMYARTAASPLAALSFLDQAILLYKQAQ